MKQIYIILVLLLTVTTAMSQVERTQLNGTITNALEEPQEGITVFNNNSLEGTVTNENGKFYLDVKAGDKLSFRAVQYDPFVLTVSQNIVDQGSTELKLTEGVNLLDEVVIEDQSMIVEVRRNTVDVELDKVSEFNTRVAAVDRIENTFTDRVRKPEEYPIRNEAFQQSQLRYNSFNMLGLLAGLIANAALQNVDLSFDAARPNKEFKEVLLKNEYSTEYLVDYLNIPEEKLYEYMVFAQEKGLNKAMLRPENEINLLQFLDATATEFKKRNPANSLPDKNE
jgi:hypothetical protein